jgi:hypothetical protein
MEYGQGQALTPARATRDFPKTGTVLGGLRYWANLAQTAGLSGLVVTVDGFETEYRDPDQYMRLVQTMNVFGRYFRKELNMPQIPLGLFVSCMAGETELPEDMAGETVAVTASHVWKLKKWDSGRRVRLAAKIQEVYCGAYRWDHTFDEGFVVSVEKAVMKRLADSPSLSSSLVCFIKIFIGLLDTEAAK